MTRVLYWNIQQFGENVLQNTERTRRNRIFSKYYVRDVQMRRNYVLAALTQPNPDIIVIVEVACNDQAPENTLIYQTGGFNGLYELLNELRNTHAPDWDLVPPIVVGTQGRAEGVGVFFRSAIGPAGARYFTGPNRFSGTSHGESFRPGPGAPAPGAYPVDGQPSGMTYFGGNRNIPPASVYNGGFTENRCAARTSYASIANGPGDVDFHGLRSPYMTTFFEDDGAGATRNLSVVAVHAPPNHAGSRQFVTDMADCTSIANPNLPNEVRLIVGDFNINLFRNDGTQTTGYNPLTANLPAAAGNYQLLIRRNPATPWNANTTPGYFATHIMAPKLRKSQARGARLSSSNAKPKYYPGYGYIGSMNADVLYSLDNVLVRPAAVGVQTSIVNAVVSSPMNNPAWAGGGTAPPYGHVPLATSMIDGVPPNTGNPNNRATNGAWNRQLGFENYGHIYEGSDHLPLITDV